MASKYGNEIVSNAYQYLPPQDSLHKINLTPIRTKLGAKTDEYIYFPIVKFRIHNVTTSPTVWKGVVVEDFLAFEPEVHYRYSPDSNAIDNVYVSISSTALRIEGDICTVYWKTTSTTLQILWTSAFPSAFMTIKKQTPPVFVEIDYDAEDGTNCFNKTIGDSSLDVTNPAAPQDIYEAWTTRGDVTLNLNEYATFIVHVRKPRQDASYQVTAETPTITKQPKDVEFYLGATDMRLTTYAVVSDHGSNSGNYVRYQWYTNTVPQNYGGTAMTGYTFNYLNLNNPAVGTYYYYCMISNDLTVGLETKTSETYTRAVTVVVKDIYEAEAPVIYQQPQHNNYVMNKQASQLFVGAEVYDGGTLTYEWFYSTTPLNQGGISIVGAVSDKYVPITSYVGTVYYYCVVTNTIRVAGYDFVASTVTEVAKVETKEVTESVPEVPRFKAYLPYSYTYDEGDTADLMSIDHYDLISGYVPTYQWYYSTSRANANSSVSNPIIVPGATSKTYRPLTTAAAVGTRQYFCRLKVTDPVTQTSSVIDSPVFQVKVIAKSNAQVPTPIGPDMLPDIVYGQESAPEPLVAETIVDDGGNLTYQWWYSYTAPSAATITLSENYTTAKTSGSQLPSLPAGRQFGFINTAAGVMKVFYPDTNVHSGAHDPYGFGLLAGDAKYETWYWCVVTNYCNVATGVQYASKAIDLGKVTVKPGIVYVNYWGAHAGKRYKFLFLQENNALNVAFKGLQQETIMTPRGELTEWVLVDQVPWRGTYLALECFFDSRTVMAELVSNIVYKWNESWPTLDADAQATKPTADSTNVLLPDPDMETEYNAPTSFYKP